MRAKEIEVIDIRRPARGSRTRRKREIEGMTRVDLFLFGFYAGAFFMMFFR